jgi:hypothetical protein
MAGFGHSLHPPRKAKPTEMQTPNGTGYLNTFKGEITAFDTIKQHLIELDADLNRVSGRTVVQP